MSAGKKIKVLMITGGFPPVLCGIGDYSYFLCSQLAKFGLDVAVLTSSYLGIKEEKNPVVIMPKVRSWRLLNIFSILRDIREADPDILHIQYPNIEYGKNLGTNILPVMVKIMYPRIRVIQTFHEPIRELTLLGKLRFLLNFPFADGRIFVEKENYETLPFFLKTFAAAGQPAFIPIASNIPRAKPGVGVKNRIIKKFHAAGKMLLMTFGFITQVKGYEALFEVFDQKKHVWVHIGEVDKENPYQVQFLCAAEKLGIKINLTGHMPEKDTAGYLSASDVCVFPFTEGVTDRHGSFLAAANQGVYIVAFHRSKRGYRHMENVYYCGLGDIESLKKAVAYKKHGKIVKTYIPTWEQIAKKHVEFYHNIMQMDSNRKGGG